MNDSNYMIIELLESSVSKQTNYSVVVVSMVIFSITCVLGIPGNVFIIWIAGVKSTKTVNTICYVNLALVDLLCCLGVPLIMSVISLEAHFPYGAATCKFFCSFIDLKMFAGGFILSVISFYRFALLIWPAWSQNHSRISRASLLCALAWLLALILNLPQLIYSDTEVDGNKTFCFYHISQTDNSVIRGIYFTRLAFGFLVPLLVTTACYLLIARSMTMEQFRSQKALRVTVGVVTAFFVCWIPYYTVYLMRSYGDEKSSAKAWAALPLVASLACCNSCLNPVLYMLMDQDFTERVRVSLRGLQRWAVTR